MISQIVLVRVASEERESAILRMDLNDASLTVAEVASLQLPKQMQLRFTLGDWERRQEAPANDAICVRLRAAYENNEATEFDFRLTKEQHAKLIEVMMETTDNGKLRVKYAAHLGKTIDHAEAQELAKAAYP